MKTYVLYHHPCPDGCTAAAVAKRYLPADTIFIGVNYGQPVPEIGNSSQVYILDFSYPREQLIELAKRVNLLRVIDHHQTARANCEGMPYCAFDMTRSGAALTAAWFQFLEMPVKPPPPLHVLEFVKYVEDRDLWKFELPRSREFSAALRAEPFDVDRYAQLMADPSTVETFKSQGVGILKSMNQAVDTMCKQARLVQLQAGQPPKFDAVTMAQLLASCSADWWQVPCVNASVYFSEVGERLLELYPYHQFSAYYFDRADKRQWGLRSRPEFDCSVVAKAMGGGGHKNAAGFTTAL